MHPSRSGFAPNSDSLLYHQPDRRPLTLSRVAMPLFDVPGWNIPEHASRAPVSSSKKRKRASSAYDVDIDIVQANVEKVMQQFMGGSKGSDGTGSPQNQKKKNAKGKVQAKDEIVSSGESSQTRKKNKPATTSKDGLSELRTSSQKKDKTHAAKQTPSHDLAVGKSPYPSLKKHKRNNNEGVATKSASPANASPSSGSADAGLTALQKKMKNSLDGARFRCACIFLTKSHPLTTSKY
jgi:ribosomal RNA-processing protein 8